MQTPKPYLLTGEIPDAVRELFESRRRLHGLAKEAGMHEGGRLWTHNGKLSAVEFDGELPEGWRPAPRIARRAGQIDARTTAGKRWRERFSEIGVPDNEAACAAVFGDSARGGFYIRSEGLYAYPGWREVGDHVVVDLPVSDEGVTYPRNLPPGRFLSAEDLTLLRAETPAPAAIFGFDEAIRRLKAGRLLQRQGWNGKNMHLYLEHFDFDRNVYNLEPCIVMVTAQGKHQPGWLASQADMLAEDWQEVARG